MIEFSIIRNHLCVLSALVLSGAFYDGLCFADTPMNARIPEGVVRKIECSTTARDWQTIATPGVYHYQVWLPKDYYRDKDRRYPAIFIASPGGNAGMENLKKVMAERKWIVVMLVESKNGCSTGVAAGNFLSAHNDAVKRFRLQEGMKFVTGFSGGARIQSFNAGLRPGFAGIILQGAGFFQDSKGCYCMESVKRNPDLCVYGIFGLNDSNRGEMGRVDTMLPKSTSRRFSCFAGGHDWAPSDRMEDAIDWVAFNALLNLDLSGNGGAFLNTALDDALANVSRSGQTRIKGFFALSELNEVLERRNLKTHDVFKARAAQVESRLKNLSAESDIHDELAAKAEYESIAIDESAALVRMQVRHASLIDNDDGNSDTVNALVKIAERYDACAKKYHATIYGQRASARSKVTEFLRKKGR